MSVVVCSDPLVEELRGVGSCVEQDGDGYCAEGYHCSWDFVIYLEREREKEWKGGLPERNDPDTIAVLLRVDRDRD